MYTKSIQFHNFILFFKSQISDKIGFYFYFSLHLIFLLFVIGLPDFFKSPPINIPTVIPIEIINITDTTSIPKEIDIKEMKENPVKEKPKSVSKKSSFDEKIDLLKTFFA